MSKKILEIEGVYTSFGISGGNLGYDFRLDDVNLADTMRMAVGAINDQEVVLPDEYSPYLNEKESTLKVRVTVEVLEGEVS